MSKESRIFAYQERLRRQKALRRRDERYIIGISGENVRLRELSEKNAALVKEMNRKYDQLGKSHAKELANLRLELDRKEFEVAQLIRKNSGLKNEVAQEKAKEENLENLENLVEQEYLDLRAELENVTRERDFYKRELAREKKRNGKLIARLDRAEFARSQAEGRMVRMYREDSQH